jgi:hypothetical protein
MDEMKGFGENIVSLAHCQTWIFIGTYEFRMIFFPRAWLSVGKAARLALMLGLNRLDGVGLDVKQSILPPRDWTEREERRRVFWAAFSTDRYSSVGTGWPLLIDENDVSISSVNPLHGVVGDRLTVIRSGPTSPHPKNLLPRASHNEHFI